MSKIVDIIPIANMDGQYLKITDSHQLNLNNKVNSLLNLLCLQKSTLMCNPELGDYSTLISIPFGDLDDIVEELRRSIGNHLTFPVDLTYKTYGVNNEIVKLYATLEGLPGKIEFDMRNYNSEYKLINPKFIKDNKD